VTLATVHRVKGQEWPVVIVVAVSDGIVPHRLAEDREEERRVLHVAITRGADRVVLLADAGRPSPFLAELDPKAPRPVHRPSEAPPRRSASARPAAARPSADPGSGVPTAGPSADPVLLERLRAWRSVRARADGVPAYVVLHDRHLEAIAAASPTTLTALARIEGMGPRRLELYADDLLSITTG
jgi:DNA helicase-2/ATP-dependent DNA helicase PcrA